MPYATIEDKFAYYKQYAPSFAAFLLLCQVNPGLVDYILNKGSPTVFSHPRYKQVANFIKHPEDFVPVLDKYGIDSIKLIFND